MLLRECQIIDMEKRRQLPPSGIDYRQTFCKNSWVIKSTQAKI
jgi:hypothetical protein